MDKAQFWQLIEASQNKKRDCEKQAAELEKLLVKLSPEEIISFDHVFEEHSRESYRWDWWAVAYIVNGGCSDDGFEYFRFWVIAQGKDYFEAAMQTPERAADVADSDQGCECESISYSANHAYEAVTGKPMPPLQNLPSRPSEPTGEPWREEDLETLFPRLCEKFG